MSGRGSGGITAAQYPQNSNILMSNDEPDNETIRDCLHNDLARAGIRNPQWFCKKCDKNIFIPSDAHVAQTERMIQRLRMELRDAALMYHVSAHGIDASFVDCKVPTCQRSLAAYADSEQSPLRGLLIP